MSTFVHKSASMSARHSLMCCMPCRVGTRTQHCRRMTGLSSWMQTMWMHMSREVLHLQISGTSPGLLQTLRQL